MNEKPQAFFSPFCQALNWLKSNRKKIPRSDQAIDYRTVLQVADLYPEFIVSNLIDISHTVVPYENGNKELPTTRDSDVDDQAQIDEIIVNWMRHIVVKGASVLSVYQ